LQSIKFIKVYITGITLQSRKYGASCGSHVVFVEGIDRRKETDENGWFQIQVEDRASFTVRAIFEGYVAAAEVKQPGAVVETKFRFLAVEDKFRLLPVEINFRFEEYLLQFLRQVPAFLIADRAMRGSW
jgi:hypothetical protein